MHRGEQRRDPGSAPERPEERRIPTSENRVARAFLLLMGMVVSGVVVTSLWNGELREAIRASGFLLVAFWLSRNLWFLHERPFDGDFFSRPANFRSPELLVVAILLVLLPSFLAG